MRLLRWVALFFWVLIICWLSFSSLEQLTLKAPIGSDKLAHIGMYFILGVLVVITQKKITIWYKLLMSLAFLFAGLTELIQHYFVTNRVGDYYDFLANVIGLLAVVVLAKRFYKT